jgi:hypothetical protein
MTQENVPGEGNVQRVDRRRWSLQKGFARLDTAVVAFKRVDNDIDQLRRHQEQGVGLPGGVGGRLQQEAKSLTL